MPDSLITLQDRAAGMFLGLAVGDALGTTLEFEQAGFFRPITGIVGGGPFDLKPGYWTDDTSMALCLADGLLARGGYDSRDAMERYARWRDNGYRSSIGMCFDIGSQTSESIDEYLAHPDEKVSAEKTRSTSAGNGAIMRLAPVIIAAFGNTEPAAIIKRAQVSARETHFSKEAEAATEVFAAMLIQSMNGNEKEAVIGVHEHSTGKDFDAVIHDLHIDELATINPSELSVSGYIIASLRVAIWGLLAHNDFKSGALAVVNLGGDADTNGAIYGQLAGAYYGAQNIPKEWVAITLLHEEIETLSHELLAMPSAPIVFSRFGEDDEPVQKRTPHIEVIQGDITTFDGDAIVNAANTSLFGGSGVCGAIFDAAGYDEMTDACRAIGHCDYGDAVVTPGFRLPARHVIHTVGPIYGQHLGDEPSILASCYQQSLQRADELHVSSIAFPMISTGIYGYPKVDAADIAVRTINEYFEDTPDSSVERVMLYAFTDDDEKVVRHALGNLV